ncbi:ATP-binding protein [Sulfurirhabdus autotrophica]|uniref:histidine kinase n=2 Tax=Sulfurirhabdus autotrophica TaxID=1706046 RepID=A0A4R3XVR8_9PROT|nr:ATP-binding protein [Sulfurirhabdus autotrophica]TCV82901.1 two-component system sensor histidine kinase PhoQ [Sulfurirhabdus autotrophica]
MMSLNKRMLLSASLVLAIFITLTAITLDRAFRESALSAREDRLLGQLYMLIASAEVDAQGHLTLPSTLSEPRLNLPDSGLYAYITDSSGTPIWHSPSVVSTQAPFLNKLSAGDNRFEERKNPDGHSFLVQSLGVNWSVANSRHGFTFSVSENLTEFNSLINHYRRNLWGWLAGLGFLLLLAQVAALRWGLKPLRQVTQEISAIESGQQEKLLGSYPSEIKHLSDNINSLLQHEHAQQKRYRNGLADVAHSLKTPLAVVRGALSGTEKKEAFHALLEEQISRMDNIVAYQLQRAATAGASKLSAPIHIKPIAEKIIGALSKVHFDKNISTQLIISDDLTFRGDEGDLMELLGNLIENACKWCHSQIKITGVLQDKLLVITIEDDGPGIAPSQIELILQRGVRADQSVPGHGIGLAIVRDILQAYQGEIQIGRSDLGGASISLHLPASY